MGIAVTVAVSATSWWLLLAVSMTYVAASAGIRLMCRRSRRREAVPAVSRSAYPGAYRLVEPLSALSKLIVIATPVVPCVLLVAGRPFDEIVFWTSSFRAGEGSASWSSFG